MNNPGYREHEIKFRIKRSLSITELIKVCNPSLSIYCNTKDWYWRAPGSAQFVRLRKSKGHDQDGKPHSMLELTVKKKDKGHNVDRLEVNVRIDDIAAMRRLLTLTLGAGPSMCINKAEVVLFCKNSVVVSWARINNEFTILEVEAPTAHAMHKWVKKVTAAFPHLKREERSLYEMLATT